MAGIEGNIPELNQVVWFLTINGWIMLLSAAPILFLIFRAFEIQVHTPDYGTSQYYERKNKNKHKKKKSLKHKRN